MEPILDTLINREDSLRVRFFPVRHYSPTSARMLREVAEAINPVAVLIEGPSDFNEQIEELYLEHELPVALFSYVRYSDNTRASAFYPFCEFSPEWQALQLAQERGIPASFIDKPWYEIAHRAEQRKHRYADRKFTENNYIESLCERLEVEDFDEVWDVLFELDPDLDADTYLTRAYHFVYQLRFTGGEATYEDEQREAFMAERIREALKEHPEGMVLVVTGGFHSPALNARLRNLPLDDLFGHGEAIEEAVIEGSGEGDEPPVFLDAEGNPIEDPELIAQLIAAQQPPEREVIDHGITMTPFTYERIDRMSGYQSGVHGPAFYEYVWRTRNEGGMIDGRELLYDIITKLRDKGQVLSTSDAIAVETTAWALASMRGRKELWRYDLLDALNAAVIKEETDAEYEHPVIRVAREVFCGERRGLLGEGTDLPPLVRNTRKTLHRLNLTPGQKKKVITLELLKPEDLEKSQLLHRCRVLEITGFNNTHSTDLVHREDLSNPTETWELIWSPEHEAKLIENAIYGADLAEAATSKLLEKAQDIQRNAEDASLIVIDATLMGLHESTEELYERLNQVVNDDPDFFHLTSALEHLLYLYAFDEVFGGKEADNIPEILGVTFNRSLWIFESLGHVVDRDRELIEAIGSLFYTFQRCEHERFTDRHDFVSLFSRIGRNDDQMPIIRGATLGALFSLGESDMDEVLSVMNYFSDPMDLGDFLIGFFSLAREAAQRDARLLEQLNTMIMDLNEEQFWEVLPGLRLAFTFFTPREKHRLIDMLFPREDAAADADEFSGLPFIDALTFDHAQGLTRRVLATIEDYHLRSPRRTPELEGEAADDFAQPQNPPLPGEAPPQTPPSGGESGESGEPDTQADTGDAEGGQQGQQSQQGQQGQQGTTSQNQSGPQQGRQQGGAGNQTTSTPQASASQPGQQAARQSAPTAGPGAESSGQQAGGAQGASQASERGELAGDGAGDGGTSGTASGSGSASTQHASGGSSGAGSQSGGASQASDADFQGANMDDGSSSATQAASGQPAGPGGEPSDYPTPFTTEERMQRWKVVMGVGGEDMPCNLPESWQQREQLISYLYDREYGHGRNVRGQGGRQGSGGDRQAGSGESQLTVPDWINGVHTLFPQRVIERLEKDALDRYNIEELVTRPELLERAEPNLTLMKAVLRTKHLMDDQVLQLAKNLVRKVVQDLLEKMARTISTPFAGAVDRRRRSFMKIAKNFSAPETIRRNLKNYNPDIKKIIIQDPFFFSRIRRQVDRWQMIIVVDESGSMMDSVIYSAVSASIFWGIKALKTNLVIFDTEVVDLTDQCSDPVETLMKVQLGGGTDIAKAVRYAQSLIENPRRTIIVLVTDFYEGGNPADLVQATKEICEGGTTMLGLAALDDRANPTYDKELAQRMVNQGAHVGAMTPGELASWVAEKIR